MSEFKVGDAVRITDQSLLPVCAVGTKGLVAEIFEGRAFPIKVIYVDDTGQNNVRFRENELEVIQ